MKASDFIAKKLSQYTNHVFSGQGGSVVHILDSLSKIKKIKIVPSQNEQGASLAADAYYRSSGKIGVVIATSGPGILNTLQGMACSYYDSIPSLYISGAPVLGSIKKNNKLRQLGFQEMEVADLVRSITKYSTRITNTKNINYEIEKCIHIAHEGRPGPTLIDLPDDVQRMEVLEKIQKSFKEKKNITKNKNIDKIEKFIKNSKRPIIIIGNGVKISKIENELYSLVNKYKIPYTLTWATADLYNSNNELNIGSFGNYATRHGNFAIQNSDLLLILGCRMNGTQIGSNPKIFAPKAKKILVDIDPAELKEENGLKIDYKINTDLKLFIKSFAPRAKKFKIDKKWYTSIKDWKKRYPIITNEMYKSKNSVNPYIFFDKLSDACKENDIIIPDASANLVWCFQTFKPKKNQKIFTALNHSPMGYSIAASIGAALGSPNRKTLAIIGDGSVQMNIQEIENIKNLNLPIKIFIINNQGYGMVKQTIDTWLNKNYVGCDKNSGLSIPDFQKVFAAYGIETCEINNHNDLPEKIEYVMNCNKPIMCDVKVDPNARITPKLKPGSPLHDMLPSLPSDEVKDQIKF
jgi:acetolactate synthase-1/2/3 large subunit